VPSVDLGDLGANLLIVLARAQLAAGQGGDAESVAFERCVQAALAIVGCDVPWAEGDQAAIGAWAERPEEYAERQVVQWLLWSGLAGIVLGRLKASETVYNWLCSALQDTRDLHLVWGVALMSAKRMIEARACLSRLGRRDELASALIAVSMLQESPGDAEPRLRSLLAASTQPAVRELMREALEALVSDEDIADLAAADPAN
jgi:hypothetical protein